MGIIIIIMGLRLAALRAPGAPLSKGAPLGHGLASPVCVQRSAYGHRHGFESSRTKNDCTNEKHQVKIHNKGQSLLKLL